MLHGGWGREPLATVSPHLYLSVTVEPLLVSRCFFDDFLVKLSIEGYYVGQKNAIFWEVLTAVTMQCIWGY
jgi:hypothetical protein